jgi:ADP-heptose:LPS heptosyltransferase
MKELNRLLIVRTDRLGDVVLSLPLSKIIKDKYPDVEISFLLRGYTKDLAEGHPFIDHIILLEEENGSPDLLANIRKLRSMSFDACLVVYPTFRIALILFLAGIKERIGTGYRWYSILFNKRIYEHRKHGLKHELEYNLNMLKLLGIDTVDNSKIAFDLGVENDALDKVSGLLEKKKVKPDVPMIIVHPGSGGSAVDLPISRLKELVSNLSSASNAQIVLTGSKAEISICNQLEIDKKIINFAGLLTLKELIALISLSGILVANSTGPIHIAAALGKYVIGFYPKIPECSAVRWGPYTDRKFIFSPIIECGNCTKKQCEELNCMNSIDLKNVESKIMELLKGKHEEI